MSKWRQSRYRSAHDSVNVPEADGRGLAGVNRGGQTMDTAADVERPRPRRSTSSTSRLAAEAKDYPRGWVSGQYRCAIPELTQVAFAGEAAILIRMNMGD
jgi:hypothetical protein